MNLFAFILSLIAGLTGVVLIFVSSAYLGVLVSTLSILSAFLQYRASFPYKLEIVEGKWKHNPAPATDDFVYPQDEYSYFIPVKSHGKGKHPSVETYWTNGEIVECGISKNGLGDVTIGVSQPMDLLVIIK